MSGSAYSPPTENLVDFNSSVFKTANEGSLTLSQAKGLFLGRTGTPNSVATTTTFNGALTTTGKINNVVIQDDAVGSGGLKIGIDNSIGATLLPSCVFLGDRLKYGGSPSYTNNNTFVGSDIMPAIGGDIQRCVAIGQSIFQTSQNQADNVAIGYFSCNGGGSQNTTAVGSNSCRSTAAANNTAVGSSALRANTTGTNNVAVGYNAFLTGATFSNSTALGAATVIGASTSTAIGYGATTTIANSIVLGTATETAYFPGTVINTSLRTTSNIVVNGAAIGIGNGVISDGNIYIGNGDGNLGSGGSNTMIGRNQLAPTDALSVKNTFLGTNSGLNTAQTGQVENTIIGAFNYNQATAYANTSCLGYACVIGGNFSTAIGSGATTTLANQIMLGRTQETVYCSGIPTTGATTYTSLVLSSGLQLQTVYTSQPTANQLGYRIALSNVAISALTSTTPASFGALALTVGTWSINFTFELLNSSVSSSVTAQTYYFSTASGGSYASTRILNTGTFRKQSSETWAIGDNPAVSASSVYVATSSISIYPTIQLAFTGGTITGAGWASATRIA
jgi:hypothetical protein